jgi:hypothetical protein
MTRLWLRLRAGIDAHSAWVYALFVAALLLKVLWGYWARDLTFGDTSSYFRDATTWSRTREINIVWSPLYTAYFGTWWSLLGDAVSATLAHRVALIVLSTGLVAWLAWRTLPQALAVLLVAWWIVLPIHYDTLYEVHLFGAIPLIVLTLLVHGVPLRWRLPLWMSVTLTTFLLVRNEYIVLFAVLCTAVGWGIWKSGDLKRHGGLGPWAGRYVLCLALPLALAAGVYQLSYVKGANVAAASSPKHTLNMCQVYAFGHQQRHPEWVSSPWTECQNLMLAHFGKPMPTLGQMLLANPTAVVEHFAWNLSLFPAGLELLLFNATGGTRNPDYAPAIVWPIYPTMALLTLLMVAGLAGWRVYRHRPPEGQVYREALWSAWPLIIGGLLMVMAIVLTQRPRPSYLLGFGVLLMWSVCMLVSAAWPRLRQVNAGMYLPLLTAGIVVLSPSYSALPLPSKQGTLTDLYRLTQPQSKALCRTGGVLALGEYTFELASYLCSPSRDLPRDGGLRTVALGALSGSELQSPDALVTGLARYDVTALVIDPPLFDSNPGLGGCTAVQHALTERGWVLLAFRRVDEQRCFAAFMLPAIDKR